MQQHQESFVNDIVIDQDQDKPTNIILMLVGLFSNLTEVRYFSK